MAERGAPAGADEGFAGRVAVITGGASGIGAALATALAGRGARVVLADLDGEGAARVAGGLGPEHEGFPLDVTDAEAVRRLVEETRQRHGRLDLLFNNAGIGAGGPTDELGLDLWRRAIEVDLLSVAYGVAAAYPLMVGQGHGHIVNTASLAGLVPSPYLVPYAAAKHGVVGLSLSLRAEAAARGVRVSVVCPGPVDTPLLDRSNPPDVAGPATRFDARKLLTNALGPAYPPGDLAEEVLEGVAANRGIIVAPATARRAWELYRHSPEALVDGLAAQTTAALERRRGASGANPGS